MTEYQPIRRYPDGSIDYRFYHAKSAALRSQAMRDAFKLKSAAKFTLIAASIVAGIAIAASVRGVLLDADCNACSPAAQVAATWTVPPAN